MLQRLRVDVRACGRAVRAAVRHGRCCVQESSSCGCVWARGCALPCGMWAALRAGELLGHSRPTDQTHLLLTVAFHCGVPRMGGVAVVVVRLELCERGV